LGRPFVARGVPLARGPGEESSPEFSGFVGAGKTEEGEEERGEPALTGRTPRSERERERWEGEPALRGAGPGLGPRGERERKRGELGPRGGKRDEWAGWLGSFPFPFFFYTPPNQTILLEFKYDLNSNLYIQHNKNNAPA
jgi:hypothetical protein